MPRMRVLVIGGTLFIGREVALRLVVRGHDVTVLHRGDHHDLGGAVHNLQADRGDLDAMTRVLREGRYDAVIDSAYDWQKGTTPEQVEHAARASSVPHRYVFISSIAAYGAGLNRRETDPLAPADYPDQYSCNKAGSERALFRLHAESGVPVTTFRPPFVHGPRQPFDREQFFWDRLRDGRPIILPDGGDAPMQWVFVSDLADACVRALDVPEASGEAFNVAHAEPLTQRGFVEALGRAAGVAPTFVSIPRATIHAEGGHPIFGHLYFGEVLDIPPHTSIVEKAPRVLGVTPTPLDAALQISFDWYQSQPRQPRDYSFEDRLLQMAS